MKPPLRVASCQFSVEADIAHNRHYVLSQIREAADEGARVVHFCETALSGYAGVDIPDISALDWDQLRAATEEVQAAAAQHKVWVLLGSTHRLTGANRPHNSVYVINDHGRIVDRYDKRFCTGTCGPQPEMDLVHYTPGNRATLFDIDGYRCGALICYDYRFPELYRELKRQGAEVVFHSFHNARRDRQTHDHGNIWKDIVPATMMCHAATNYVWISATNSAAKYSSWPTFFVRPDGRISGRMRAHTPGVLISDVAPSPDIWDAPGPWRERALAGQLHSGELADDPRSHDRTSL
jgi:deaminated glutathione amidase